jgi:ketosteroid isomerase-like protein
MPAQTHEILTRYHQAMYDGSADDLADLYAADAVHEFPMRFPSFPARFEGREAIRAGYTAAWGASPARLEEIRDVVVHDTTDPQVIVVEQVVAGTMTTTGRSFAAAGLLVMRVRDGELVHVRDYLDATAIIDAARHNG